DWRFVPLLAGSAIFNFFLARELDRRRSKAVLAAAIGANLALLVCFKYMRFFLASVEGLGGAPLGWPQFVLPLGISFFTFTQIMVLVVAYSGLATGYRFSHYLLFVTV